jgi:hypothetical protein
MERIDIEDFVVGENFINVGDSIFSTNRVEINNDDYNKRDNTFDTEKLNDINIVYLHTMYKNQFFHRIKNLDNNFVVVTHNSDLNINDVDNLPNNVIKWFAQNVNCVDDRLESIPIGLENGIWYSNIEKPKRISNKLNEDKNIQNLVYMNHNIATNEKERIIPFNVLSDKKFVTTELCSNGVDYDNYINKIYNHKFVISPEGNGIDCHRTWEVLYLKSIPIQKKNINNQYYTDLPICFVDSWEDITEDFLNKEYDRIINSNWNLDKLKMTYWIDKIQNTKNQI